MAYQYRIWSINDSERWIYIRSDDSNDCEDPDSFIYLVKAIQKDVGGDVVEVGASQYMVSGEKLGLVYQWDGVFGITVVYPSNTTKERAVAFLNKYMC